MGNYFIVRKKQNFRLHAGQEEVQHNCICIRKTAVTAKEIFNAVSAVLQ